ncbi:hypothetical protein BC938DRAFT_476854 [Jimgerdemannia flammicorona]|uniref:Uncharacterized protein n=1 Tax=Jimgerdemannia flammicorona TaxID=994334 RepID=A0A433PDW3_9FUNG|nr:hypothetical protein BC938DRAFT_476854 [Jimgerdemannia flammicorona]
MHQSTVIALCADTNDVISHQYVSKIARFSSIPIGQGPKGYPKDDDYPKGYPKDGDYPKGYPKDGDYPKGYPPKNYPKGYPPKDYPKEYPEGYPKG